MAGIHQRGGGRRCHGDEPGPGPKRSTCGQPRRPGGQGRPRHHHRMAACIFVPIEPRRAERWTPQGRIVAPGLPRFAAMDLIEDRGGNADIGNLDSPRQHAARKQQMSRLQTEECHRPTGTDRRAHRLAARSVHARRQVDRQHRHAGAVDPFHGLARNALDRTRQPCPEQRVDHNRRLPRHAVQRVLRQDAGSQASRLHLGKGERRVARQAPGITEQQHLDAVPPLAQDLGGNESVAAIVAGAGQHEHLPRMPGHAAAGIGHRQPRAPHQVDAGLTAGDRQRIRPAHFGRSEKFDQAPPPAITTACGSDSSIRLPSGSRI